jgi:hypothetical protein
MFKLTAEGQARADECREFVANQRSRFANLTDDSLVATARYYMAQMRPIDWPPGAPVYDAAFWHAIVPELLRRIGDRSFVTLRDAPGDV